MQRYLNATITVDCPKCGKETDAYITALLGDGQVPRETNECKHCGATFRVHADLCLDCEVIE